MRSLSFFIIALFSACNSIAQGTAIDVRQVGSLKIDMTADDVYSIIGKENTSLVDLYLEATFSPALIVKTKTNPRSLIVELDSDKVWRITIFDPAYKTKSGIGVGSTFGELKKKHKTSIVSGEGNVFAVVRDLGVSFCLAYPGTVTEEITDKDLSDSFKITKILVF